MILFIFIEDQIGKRKVLVSCLCLTTVGSCVLLASRSMAMAVAGQYIIGFGKFAIISFGMAMISDITKPQLVQRFISVVEMGFSIGAIIGSLAYGSLKYWRTVVLYFYIIPYTIGLMLAFIFIRDTPRYLLRKCTVSEAKDSLNFVAKVNGKEPLEEQEVKQVIDQEQQFTEVKENMNPLDLCRYASIRTVTIAFCTFQFFVDMIYYAHNAITDEIGINPTINLILMSVAEILSAIVLNLLVNFIPQKATGIIVASMGVTFSFIVILLKVPSNCEGCSQAVLQIGLIMAARFCLRFDFALYYVCESEFYPSSVKSIGFATSALCGSFGDVISLIFMAYIRQLGVNPFLVVGILFTLLLLNYKWIPETYHMKPQDQVGDEEDGMIKIKNICQSRSQERP